MDGTVLPTGHDRQSFRGVCRVTASCLEAACSGMVIFILTRGIASVLVDGYRESDVRGNRASVVLSKGLGNL
jgi:hypothetical protein